MQPLVLVSIHVVGTMDAKSSNICLVALSSTGIRFFFSAVPFNSAFGVGSANKAFSAQLLLLHVRFPPSELIHPDERSTRTRTVDCSATDAAKRSSPYVMNNLSISVCIGDLCLVAQSSDTDGRDFLMGISPDLRKLSLISQSSHIQTQASFLQFAPTYNNGASHAKLKLAEQATLLYVEGTIWSISDLRRESMYRHNLGNAPVFNDLANQYSEPRREFVVVTDAGITFIVKRRVIDYLRDALEEVQSDGNAQPIIDFRNK